MLRIFLALSLLLTVPNWGYGEDFEHGVWDNLLRKNVVVLSGGQATQVDYQGMLDKRGELQGYLESVSQVSEQRFDSWDKDSQLAFLINVYNSWTVEFILTKYPDLASIKDLGSFFSSPWKKKIVNLFGVKKSLDEVEHDMIRKSGRYNDPRIHFAVNCASIGCPALRAEAYTGEHLQRQLEEATSLFLNDRSRNRLSGETLEVSSIFKWYRKDFEKGWLGYTSLSQFFISRSEELQLNQKQQQKLQNGEIIIEFLSYDWSLNKVVN